MFKLIFFSCLLLSSLNAAPYGHTERASHQANTLSEVQFEAPQSPIVLTTSASYGDSKSYSQVEATTLVIPLELPVVTTASYNSQAPPRVELVELTSHGYNAPETTTFFVAPMVEETTAQAYYAPETTALPPRIELDSYNTHFTAPPQPPMVEFETTTAAPYSHEEIVTVFMTLEPMLEQTTQSYYAAPETTTFFVLPQIVEETTQSYYVAPETTTFFVPPQIVEETTQSYYAAPETTTFFVPPQIVEETTQSYYAAPETTTFFVPPQIVEETTQSYYAAPETTTFFVPPQIVETTTHSYAAPQIVETTTHSYAAPQIVETTTHSYAAPQPVMLQTTTAAYATPTLNTLVTHIAAQVTTNGYGSAPTHAPKIPIASIVHQSVPVLKAAAPVASSYGHKSY